MQACNLVQGNGSLTIAKKLVLPSTCPEQYTAHRREKQGRAAAKERDKQERDQARQQREEARQQKEEEKRKERAEKEVRPLSYHLLRLTAMSAEGRQGLFMSRLSIRTKLLTKLVTSALCAAGKGRRLQDREVTSKSSSLHVGEFLHTNLT